MVSKTFDLFIIKPTAHTHTLNQSTLREKRKKRWIDCVGDARSHLNIQVNSYCQLTDAICSQYTWCLNAAMLRVTQHMLNTTCQPSHHIDPTNRSPAHGFVERSVRMTKGQFATWVDTLCWTDLFFQAQTIIHVDSNKQKLINVIWYIR
jgi:hypothetical protein